MVKRYFLGIDLGGTKIAAAVVNDLGTVFGSSIMPTESLGGVEGVVQRMAKAAHQALVKAEISQTEISAVGVGSPGPVDVLRGVVLQPPNLPGWGNVPLKSMLKAALNLPVVVDNDANVAALAENFFGAGERCKEMVYLTISTGIGAGIISNGQLMRGAKGAAGEVGHMVLVPGGPPCGCGNRGCWEALSSGTAIAKEAARRLEQGEKSIIPDITGGGPLTARHVFLAQDQGDDLAVKVVAQAVTYLGIGVANVINILNPEKVVIGGGVARRGEPLLEPVRQQVKMLTFGRARSVKIIAAALGELGGAIGAAAIAMQGEVNEWKEQ